jgi:hypothetical protein
MRYQKLSRFAGLTSAVVVAVLTSAVAAHAILTFTTPNAAAVSYNLKSGTSSAGITPATNVPVFVMADETVPTLGSTFEIGSGL